MTQLVIANAVTAIGLAVGVAIRTSATGNDSGWIAMLVGFVRG